MKKNILLLALICLIALLSACQKAEEVTVTQYFQAMQGDDRDTMSAMAYIPKDIPFESYEILSIDEPMVKELLLPALLKKQKELVARKKPQADSVVDKQDLLDEANDELEETRRSSKKAELEKKIETLEAEIAVEKGKFHTLQIALGKIKKRISMEKELMEKSAGMRDNLELFKGETSLVKVSVRVTLEKDGGVQDYVLLLRGDTLRLEGKEQKGRLIVIDSMTSEEYDKFMAAEEALMTLGDEEVKPEEVTEDAPATEGETPTEEKPEEKEEK